MSPESHDPSPKPGLTARAAASASVAEWLAWLERSQGARIDLGLDRVRCVVERLGLTSDALRARPRPLRVVTVAGTNGKGTVVHAVDAIVRATTTLTVGRYTSPHLFDFRERIVIDGRPVADSALVEAFERVAGAAGLSGPVSDGGAPGCASGDLAPVPLTYFEFTTLAMMVCFARADVDVAVLEVGLGGRLDAVNVWDADVTAVTSIARDHEAFLGSSLDAIAREKAGIARAGVPCWVGALDVPAALYDALNAHRARVRAASSFGWSVETRSGGVSSVTWWWRPQALPGDDPDDRGARQAADAATSGAPPVEIALAIDDAPLARDALDRRDPPGRTVGEVFRAAVDGAVDGARGRNLAVAVGIVHDLFAVLGTAPSGRTASHRWFVPVSALCVRPPGRFEVREVVFTAGAAPRRDARPDAQARRDPSPSKRVSAVAGPSDAGLSASVDSATRAPTVAQRRRLIVDVAHNPAAVAELLAILEREDVTPADVVFGAMADKDIGTMLRICARQTRLAQARWWLGAPAQPRAAPVARLVAEAQAAGLARVQALPALAAWPSAIVAASAAWDPAVGVVVTASPRAPHAAGFDRAGDAGRVSLPGVADERPSAGDPACETGPILVFGSFHTVAEALSVVSAEASS